MKYVAKIFIILAFAALTSACGKVSDPSPYPDSGYPHQYPRQ